MCARLQAIQSYRATMAVLRQQAAFVQQLFDTGVIDDMEREELLRWGGLPCCLFWLSTRPVTPCPVHSDDMEREELLRCGAACCVACFGRGLVTLAQPSQDTGIHAGCAIPRHWQLHVAKSRSLGGGLCMCMALPAAHQARETALRLASKHCPAVLLVC
jgi:hypothetical protein